MDKNNVLSASGSITKKEIVRSIKIKSLTDHVILESSDPFPEVHHREKKKVQLPKYFYIGIKQKQLDQDVLISTRNAERELHEQLNSALGDIELENEKYNVIRVKNVSSKLLADLIKSFKNHGVEIISFNNNINEPAVIHTKKFFYLEEVDQGLFMDLDEPDKGYLEVPRRFKWEEFEEISEKVKKESQYKNFDAAIGEINKHGVNQNLIRIYSPLLTEEMLLEIGKGFIKYLFA